MRKLLKSQVMVVLTLVLTLSACEDYLEINDSPNNVTDAPIGQLLTSATVATGFIAGSDGHRFSAILAQQFGGQGTEVAQTREYMRYQISPSDVNNLWSNYYAVILADLELVIQKSSETSPHYAGIAKLLKAYIFSQVVDLWGDVPYTEALKFTGVQYPVYDPSSGIYTQLFALIDSGIADMGKTSILAPGTFDTIYGGNASRWIRFGNTLKLRMYMRQSKSNASTATSAINALISSNATFIDAVEHNFQHNFLTTSGRQNPIHQFEANRVDQFFPHESFVGMMNTKQDPRRAFYFTPFPYNSNPATYKGVAAVPGTQAFNYSRMHTYLRGGVTAGPSTVNPDGSISATAITYNGTAPTRMLTAAEYNFIRAEATVRFNSPGNSATFFEQGIRASMTMAGVVAADANAYVTARLAEFNAADNSGKIRQILEEKYTANYGVPLEAWSDWRRTGIPSFIAPPANAALNISGGSVPRILPYPLGEVSSNPNTPARATLNVGRVFWDTP
jgi:hypothetical protein